MKLCNQIICILFFSYFLVLGENLNKQKSEYDKKLLELEYEHKKKLLQLKKENGENYAKNYDKVERKNYSEHIGVSIFSGEITSDFADITIDLNGLSIKGGGEVHQNLEIVANLTFAEGNLFDGDLEVTLFSVGLFAKIKSNSNALINPYFFIGFSYTSLTTEIALLDFSEEESDSDLSFGVGIEFSLDENIALHLEYINLNSDSDGDVHGVNLGLAFKF